eukprot:1154731-Pelagomonas_calceolata.AAC.8
MSAVMSLRDVALHGQGSLLTGHPMSNVDQGPKLGERAGCSSCLTVPSQFLSVFGAWNASISDAKVVHV